jgi:hypothetical protein
VKKILIQQYKKNILVTIPKLFVSFGIVLFSILLGIQVSAQTVTDTISISATVVNTVSSSGGGGGGGGGSSSVQPPKDTVGTDVVFAGVAYPSGKIRLLQNSVVVASAVARADGVFSLTFRAHSSGVQIFSLSAEDTSARRSGLISIPMTIESGTVTTVNALLFSPTLSLNKNTLLKSTPLLVSGQSIVGGKVSIYIDGSLTTTVSVDTAGRYSISLDTNTIPLGIHTIQVQTKTLAGKESALGLKNSFKVTAFATNTPDVTLTKNADISGDGVISLTDFSILAYWYGKKNAPAVTDLNGDGAITLADFSILAYQWNE